MIELIISAQNHEIYKMIADYRLADTILVVRTLIWVLETLEQLQPLNL